MNFRDYIWTVWAPHSSPWSAWSKPVLFSHLRNVSEDAPPTTAPGEMFVAVENIDGSTAVVVDLPGMRAVRYGLLLAENGFRPVPLFNALPGPSVSTAQPAVLVWPIVDALTRGASKLMTIDLPIEAPPAFLLDANRRYGLASLNPGDFDNRSVSLSTDFPSAVFLHARGIQSVVLIQQQGSAPQEDLAHTLRRWQEAGIKLFVRTIADATQSPLLVKRPSAFRSLWQRIMIVAGLKQSPLGGFGGTLPMPSSG